MPSIPTQPLSTGRSFVVPSSASWSQSRSAASASFPRDTHEPNTPFSTSPSALSPMPSGSGPPQRRSDGSPGSPTSSPGGDDAYGSKNNADTVESTASAASTTSHFGFDALDPSQGGGGGGSSSSGTTASPAKDAARSPSKRPTTGAPPSRNVSASSSSAADPSQQQQHAARRIPAAQVQIDAPTGFLFEWWSVFWDVFRAQAAARRPGAVENGANARSFCQASSAAVDAAMLRRSSSLRAPHLGLGASAAGAGAAASSPQGLGRMPPNMQAQHQGPAPPLPLVAPVGAGAAASVGGRQPIPLRTAPLAGRQPWAQQQPFAQQQQQQAQAQQQSQAPTQEQAAQQQSPAQQHMGGAASARPPSRASGRRGAIPCVHFPLLSLEVSPYTSPTS